MSAYPRPAFASIDEIRIGMVVLTHSGRRLKVTHIDRRRGVVHYIDLATVGDAFWHDDSFYAGFSSFASIVESVVE